MKAKKEKLLGNFMNAGEVEIPKLRPLKHNVELKVDSFVCCRSSQIRKLLTDKPSTAIAILKHVWDQEYKDPRKRVFMNRYWKWHKDDTALAKFMLDIGKYRGRKNNKKLLSTVNRVKTKYNSLRQACRLTDILWSKFHQHTYVKSEICKKLHYTCKLSATQIKEIQDHFASDEVSSPLPDKKYANKRFLRTSVTKFVKMYNLLSTITRKISTSTFYKYKPKAVKLQGRIPLSKIAVKNAKILKTLSMKQPSIYMEYSIILGIALIKQCAGYFPNIDCMLCTCHNCGQERRESAELSALEIQKMYLC